MSIKELLKSNIPRALLVILLYTIYAISGTMSEFLFKNALNAISKLNMNSFIYWVLITGGLGLLTAVLLPIASIVFTRQIQDYLHHIRNDIVHHYYDGQGEKVSDMQNQLTGNLKMLTDDYAMPWITILSGVLQIVLGIGLLVSMNWMLLIFAAILGVITMSLPKVMEKRSSQAAEQVNQKNSKLLNVAEHWLGGLQELRRYSSQARLMREIRRASGEYAEAEKTSKKVQSWSTLINAFGNSIAQVGMGFLAGILFLNGIISFGDWTVAGSMAFMIFSAIWEITGAITQVKSTKQLRAEISALRKKVPDKNENKRPAASLRVQDLSVQYPNGETIAYPDFEIKPGEKVLLTGDSGTGKSTLFKVLLGELKPKTGTVTFLDKNKQPISADQVALGWVPQDPVVFPASIRENITMFNQKLASQVANATQKMQLAPDLAKMPNGLETMINLKQENLSGGQRQKVVLARHEIHQQSFVLLDEATSAIDHAATEKIVAQLLKNSQTILMIAHNFDPDLRAKFDREIKLTAKKEAPNV